MMKLKTYSRHTLGDTVVVYQQDIETGRVGLLIYPKSMQSRLVARRESLAGRPELRAFPDVWPMPRVATLDSLVQLRVRGDEVNNGYGAGRTMRGSSFLNGCKLQRQDVTRTKSGVEIVTTLADAAGHEIEHRLGWTRGEGGLRIGVTVRNGAAQPFTIEMLSSFSLGGLTPFAVDDAPGRLVLHRFRTHWASEGKLDSLPLEALHMERSWGSHGVTGERFGQVGTMPTRGFFPFIAIEDKQVGVIWGAQLAWAGSWQMEAWRRDDTVAISGGLADREFGHWFRTLQSGESLTTPVAHVAVGAETLDTFCQRLTGMQKKAASLAPASEKELPLLFNEFCTTWGKPSEENLLRIAGKLRGLPVRYLVMDAGWYLPESGSWNGTHGDWNPSRVLFPQGLAATARKIREAGFIPGIWFEMETCGDASDAYKQTKHLLKIDGEVYTVGGRRFWDMSDPWAVDYLSRKVIALLKETEIGYVKIDYNETLGIGCDGAESPGAGLVRHVEGVYAFFRKMREELPDLVIENCASGGHRLEPSMMALTSMSSFSDAHETVEIPVIAASLHRLILPQQSQIWATLRAFDTPRRQTYSLAAGFLGRLCLSGDVTELSPAQWTIVQNALALYRRAAPVIKDGVSHLYGPAQTNFRCPKGWQAVCRVDAKQRRALVVLHSFARPVPETVSVPLSAGKWVLDGALLDPKSAVRIAKGKLLWQPRGAEVGAAVLLKCSND